MNFEKKTPLIPNFTQRLGLGSNTKVVDVIPETHSHMNDLYVSFAFTLVVEVEWSYRMDGGCRSDLLLPQSGIRRFDRLRQLQRRAQQHTERLPHHQLHKLWNLYICWNCHLFYTWLQVWIISKWLGNLLIFSSILVGRKNGAGSRALPFFTNSNLVTDILWNFQPPRACRTKIMGISSKGGYKQVSKITVYSWWNEQNWNLDNFCSVCANDLIFYSSFVLISKIISRIQNLMTSSLL